MPKQTKLAQSLPATVPFIAPEMTERARGRAFTARLGANENGFGPAPSVLDALHSAGPEIWKYPDPSLFDLRQALSDHHAIPPNQFILGGGIDGLLGTLCRLFVDHSTHVVTSLGGYPTFNYHVAGFGGTLHQVPYKDDMADLDGLLASVVRSNATLVYLSNPDNPMGTMHSASAIEQFAEALPRTCLFILDEAYIECADAQNIPNLAVDQPNLIRFRTFSKAYGLAGARIGYGIGPADLIASFDKVRDHFGVSLLSQAAALAALADQTYLTETCQHITQARDHIAQIARDNGLIPLPSQTNFVTIDCGQGGYFARAVLQSLADQDVFVRMPMVAPLDRCIRVSVGPAAELAAFAKALPLALTQARG
ncbi:histidinol-phosphate aminotransferase [Amylibacter marinus]|uniref:histidinol-phosphate transaminase n=1 Tax=Amylibacter marinus TaxID=1475483 RepID=A0ABQ5VRF0_9RHOB|nr:histidinol-phosphate aminotransferase [Amylibacter marinus]